MFLGVSSPIVRWRGSVEAPAFPLSLQEPAKHQTLPAAAMTTGETAPMMVQMGIDINPMV